MTRLLALNRGTAAVVALTLLLAGCGGSDDDEETLVATPFLEGSCSEVTDEIRVCDSKTGTSARVENRSDRVLDVYAFGPNEMSVTYSYSGPSTGPDLAAFAAAKALEPNPRIEPVSSDGREPARSASILPPQATMVISSSGRVEVSLFYDDDATLAANLARTAQGEVEGALQTRGRRLLMSVGQCLRSAVELSRRASEDDRGRVAIEAVASCRSVLAEIKKALEEPKRNPTPPDPATLRPGPARVAPPARRTVVRTNRLVTPAPTLPKVNNLAQRALQGFQRAVRR